MRKTLILASAIALAAFSSSAQATSVTDPTGDFLSSYTGPHQGDLDVTSFAVSYNQSASAFLLQATFAGDIDPSLPGFYAIGVDTGAGAIRPFAGIGEGNVMFDKVIAVQKDGSATIGTTALAAGSVTISGNAFSVMVPLSLLPSTGRDAFAYGFNLWPRSGAGGAEVISDFAPQNALLAAGSVPEPSSWMAMACGFAGFGVMQRRARRRMNASIA